MTPNFSTAVTQSLRSINGDEPVMFVNYFHPDKDIKPKWKLNKPKQNKMKQNKNTYQTRLAYVVGAKKYLLLLLC